MGFVLSTKCALSFGRKVFSEDNDCTIKLWLNILHIHKGDQLKKGNNSIQLSFPPIGETIKTVYILYGRILYKGLDYVR